MKLFRVLKVPVPNPISFQRYPHLCSDLRTHLSQTSWIKRRKKALMVPSGSCLEILNWARRHLRNRHSYFCSWASAVLETHSADREPKLIRRSHFGSLGAHTLEGRSKTLILRGNLVIKTYNLVLSFGDSRENKNFFIQRNCELGYPCWRGTVLTVALLSSIYAPAILP